jgi:hypothetical protein
MTLSLTASRGAVTFTYIHDNMTASWTVRSEDGEEKLISTMRQVISFVETEAAKPPLPERTPGLALEMTKMAHPAPPGNGWAAMVPPELPEDRKGEWELMPSEEQDNG